MTISDLKKMTDSIFSSDHGYYICQNKIWIFLAKEKEYSSNDLLDISSMLNILNNIK